MKNFDTESNVNRLRKSARKNIDWSLLVNKGTYDNCIKLYGEMENELARYLEYLFSEKKFDNAVNITSLLHIASVVSYKRELPKSASGFMIVSHTDDEQVNRMQNIGTYIHDVDYPSNYDDLEKDSNADFLEKRALVPWTHESYTLPKGTRFIASNGTEFIATEGQTINRLTQRYSSIASDTSLKNLFELSGGWRNIKYLKVPVIQGIQKTYDLGDTDGSQYQVLVLPFTNIERASNSISKEYFSITVDGEKWEEISSLALATPYDKVFEKKILDDETGVAIKFGNGISGYCPTKGLHVVCNYLETLGESGNIDSLYSITNMVLPNGTSIKDPRTNTVNGFLSCINTTPLSGGEDMSDEEAIRDNAPSQYLKSYSTCTSPEYIKKILEISPIALMKIATSKVKDKKDLATQVSDGTFIGDYALLQNSIGITALDTNGEALSEADTTFIPTIEEKMKYDKNENDSFSYVDPVMCKVAADVRFTKGDTSYSEDDMKDILKNAIASLHGVESLDFGETLAKSNVSTTVELYDFVKRSSLKFGAIAEINYDEIAYLDLSDKPCAGEIPSVIAIPFKFPDVYCRDSFNFGFKKYSDRSNWLLKVDLVAKNGLNFKDRTLLLIDKRTNDITPSTAKLLTEGGATVTPKYTIDIDTGTEATCYITDKDSTDDLKRLCRTAQFLKFDGVPSYQDVDNALLSTSFPYEIRPYEIDTATGEIKTYTVGELKASEEYQPSSSSTKSYRKDNSYIYGIDIIYNEAEEGGGSAGDGYVVIPTSALGLDAQLSSIRSFLRSARAKTLIRSYLDIYVIAQPIQEDIDQLKWNEIAFVDKNNINVTVLSEE